jgi:hypothetical protein
MARSTPGIVASGPSPGGEENYVRKAEKLLAGLEALTGSRP